MIPVGVGIVGCGSISDRYFNGAMLSSVVRIRSCTSRTMDSAREKASRYGVAAVTLEAMLDDTEVEIVLNLTPPLAHTAIGMAALAAGKHLYTEKPLATNGAEARRLVQEAARRDLRVGAAPDTFLGAAHQACRQAIDRGAIGRPLAGTAIMLTRGMEHWHPNPGFFYRPGGGPLYDIGPYYVTELVSLLGSVTAVSAQGSVGLPVRTVTSLPRRGEEIQVEVPTTVNAALAFSSGANVLLGLSWEVWKHRHAPIEIYGTEGSLLDTDPVYFGGVPLLSRRGGQWEAADTSAFAFGTDTRQNMAGESVADYRMIGLIEMAAAIRAGRSHRASAALALHVLDVLDAIEHSVRDGGRVPVAVGGERPAPLSQGADESVLL